MADTDDRLRLLTVTSVDTTPDLSQRHGVPELAARRPPLEALGRAAGRAAAGHRAPGAA